MGYDATGRNHSEKNGRFIPKGYNDQKGIWEGQSSWKNNTRKVGNKIIFDSNDPNKFDPLQVLPSDDKKKVFDKVVATPLFIKNIDAVVNQLFEGYEKVSEGFGLSHYYAKDPNDPDGKTKDFGDEPYGIDYHVNLRDKITGEITPLRIDFKFIFNDAYNNYDDLSVPLKLFRDKGDAQFLNKNHANNLFMFMSLKSFGNLDDLINATRNGTLSDRVDKMKILVYDADSLKEKMFAEFGSEENLRSIAEQQREFFKAGLIPEQFVIGRDKITRKKTAMREPKIGRSGQTLWLITRDHPKEGLITQLSFPHIPDRYSIADSDYIEIENNKIIF